MSGIASGFTLLADQPFSTGDWIESNDIEGRVIDVNWRATRIQDRNGDLVVIPNGQLATATIVNFDQPSRLHQGKGQRPDRAQRTADDSDRDAGRCSAVHSQASLRTRPRLLESRKSPTQSSTMRRRCG